LLEQHLGQLGHCCLLLLPHCLQHLLQLIVAGIHNCMERVLELLSKHFCLAAHNALQHCAHLLPRPRAAFASWLSQLHSISVPWCTKEHMK